MNRLIAAVLLAALTASGCASLPDSIRGPFARAAHGATDAGADQSDNSPYPKQSPFGN